MIVDTFSETDERYFVDICGKNFGTNKKCIDGIDVYCIWNIFRQSLRNCQLSMKYNENRLVCNLWSEQSVFTLIRKSYWGQIPLLKVIQHFKDFNYYQNYYNIQPIFFYRTEQIWLVLVAWKSIDSSKMY